MVAMGTPLVMMIGCIMIRTTPLLMMIACIMMGGTTPMLMILIIIRPIIKAHRVGAVVIHDIVFGGDQDNFFRL